MADRYWVGGTANWDGTAGTKWATTSGGTGGAAVPTSSDDVFFDAASGAVTVTVNITVANCQNLNCTDFTGTLTRAAGTLRVTGSITLSSTMTLGSALPVQLEPVGSQTILTSGKVFGSTVALGSQGATGTVTLQDALTVTGDLSVVRGTFTTNNYAVTVGSLGSSGSSAGTINLGSSTVTITGSAFGITFFGTAPTFNAGTSQINFTNTGQAINTSSVTFYNVAFTSTALAALSISGSNTFNNLSVTGRTSAGIANFSIGANQTINGTLTLSAGTDATMRTFVLSDTIGTTRTLTCAAVDTLTDIDFRDITIAGAAAPVSGTRLGDCKGNSGITFGSGVTRYWNLAGSNNWSATGWAASSGGTPNVNNFPLAQDTAVFEATSPGTGTTTTVNAAYNIGTINMSARTSNTMTLAVGSNAPFIYGNWINGTGTTLTGTGTLTFAGRGSQTITSSGKTFTQAVTINTPGGSVTLQDAYVSNRSFTAAFALTSGTFAANGYNLTLSGSLAGFSNSGSGTRTVSIGSGTWTIAGSGTPWNSTVATNLTVTGTGTISLTSVSAKTFAGGGVQTYPTLNQGGVGTLTISGSNKFADITDTAIGRVQFTGGTTNEFTSFSLGGVSGNLLQLGSTNTTQAILKKPSAWNVGANSTDAGNNTGLSFIAGSVDYLSISYINGVVASGSISSIYYGATNVTTLYYGSTPVTAIYYGATQVY